MKRYQVINYTTAKTLFDDSFPEAKKTDHLYGTGLKYNFNHKFKYLEDMEKFDPIKVKEKMVILPDYFYKRMYELSSNAQRIKTQKETTLVDDLKSFLDGARDNFGPKDNISSDDQVKIVFVCSFGHHDYNCEEIYKRTFLISEALEIFKIETRVEKTALVCGMEYNPHMADFNRKLSDQTLRAFCKMFGKTLEDIENKADYSLENGLHVEDLEELTLDRMTKNMMDSFQIYDQEIKKKDEELNHLRKQLQLMKAHIQNMPDGELFLETQKHIESFIQDSLPTIQTTIQEPIQFEECESEKGNEEDVNDEQVDEEEDAGLEEFDKSIHEESSSEDEYLREISENEMSIGDL
jgi:hypothetical protein